MDLESPENYVWIYYNTNDLYPRCNLVINLSNFGLWCAKIRSVTNFFHSVIVDGKGIFENIMMKSEEWNIASVSSGVMVF